MSTESVEKAHRLLGLQRCRASLEMDMSGIQALLTINSGDDERSVREPSQRRYV